MQNSTPNQSNQKLAQAVEALQKMRQKVEKLEAARHEPLAIIGLACRFPGADTPESFWALLERGQDMMRAVPKDRWDLDEYYDPVPGTPGKMYLRDAALLDQLDEFDPQFFGISPREAERMDPQHRLLLEVSWEALERAGQAPGNLRNSKTGVFVGVSASEYTSVMAEAERTDTYSSLGNSAIFASGRLSYVLGLQGPSLVVDTACSASLIGVHLACESLRNRSSDMALAGGVHVLLSPHGNIAMSQMGAVAPDGRSKTFDAAANGFGRGEGCGMIVLKRLSDALADGDPILALIRGAATNHDGPSSGLTVPSATAQAALIRDALADGKLQPDDVLYVEAHGTGTPLGDPIEVRALETVFGRRRQPLWVGSVKTNIGHLEEAAGIAGLIKVVLSMQAGTLPPHLHFRHPNPHIAWENLPIRVTAQAMPWPPGRKVAGVSSFGMGGANAHVVLEEAPALAPVAGALTTTAIEQPAQLLVLSAKNQQALQAVARRYADFLASDSGLNWADVCYTAGVGRSHFGQRLGVVAASPQEARAQLAAYAAGEAPAGVAAGSEASQPPPVAFLFTGQGSQYAGMGRELYQTQPAFRRTLDRCAELLAALPAAGAPLLQLLDDPDAIDHTANAQPALFALEYALATLWRSWGVEPDVLIGHSLGELVAACVAGVFSLEDGLKLAAARGRLMGALPQNGEMVAVSADEASVRQAIAPYAAGVSIAAVNGPESVTISGLRTAVLAICEQLAAADVKTQRLNVSHAFHSPLMDPMLEPFEAVAASITYHKPALRLISNVTGKLAGDEITRPQYWVRHVRQTVRFADGLATLAEQRAAVWIEIGPKPALLGMAGQAHAAGADVALLPSLRQRQGDTAQMLASLAELYVRGVEIDWQGVYGEDSRHKLLLPTYPFQRQRYWLAAAKPRRAATVRPLIDKVMELPLHGETVYEAEFSAEAVPFLADHRIYGEIVSPGACQMAMALNAADLSLRPSLGSTTGAGAVLALHDVVLPQALVIPPEQLRTVQAVFSARNTAAGGDVSQAFKIVSFTSGRENPEWVTLKTEETATHAAGQALVARSGDAPGVDLRSLQARCTHLLDSAAFYARSAAAQVELGPAFRWLGKLWRSEDGATSETLALLHRPAASGSLAGYLLHPGLLDACFQVAATTATTDDTTLSDSTLLPFALSELRLYRPAQGDSWWCHAVQTRKHTWDMRLLDQLGAVVAEIKDFQLRAAPAAAVHGREAWHDWFYTVQWRPAAVAAGAELASALDGQVWLVLADEAGIGPALAARLRMRGARVVEVRQGQDWYDDGDLIHLAAERAEDYRRLLETVTTPDGVVHLWGMAADATAAPPTAASALAQVRRGCESALLLAQALVEKQAAPRGLWLVTQDAQAAAPGDPVSGAAQGALWGLGRVMALEHPELNPCCIDLAGTAPAAEGAAQLEAEIEAWLAADGAAPAERQVALRTGSRYVARLERLAAEPPMPVPAEPYRLEVTQRGLLDSLQLRPAPRRQPAGGEVEIEVRAAGLNFRDVLNALGAYPGDAGPLGGECAGIVAAVGPGVTEFAPGDPVLAMAAGSFGQYVTVRADLAVRQPASLSAVEAAGLPVAFLTAWYGLHEWGRMQAGDRVLIHAAAGGVGMAAVQLAQWAGAEVFATASPAKWEILRRLGVTHIYNSRTTDFAAQLLADTDGQGVDLILNSLTGPGFMEANLSALAHGGRVAEMSKRNIWSEAQVAAVRPDARYTVYDLGEIGWRQPHLWRKMLAEILQLMEAGHLRPLPPTVYPLAEAVQAFRLMQSAQHVGKIVLALPHAMAQATAEAPHPTMRAEATYLVTGGLSGLGLAVAQGLAAQGARRLLLLGRRAPGAAAQAQLAQLAEQGVTVQVVSCDVSDQVQVQTALAQVDAAHPLAGVVHSAGVLDDGALLGQRWDRFAHVLAPKVAGAWNLHELTQGIELDFFVLFSSAASVLGSRGQANYAAANACLDGLARQRRAQGLPALAINWGAWAEIGLAAESVRRQGAQLAAQGVAAIAPGEGVAAFFQLLAQPAPQVAVLPLNWPRWLASDNALRGMALLADFLTAPVQREGVTATLSPSSLQAMPGEERSAALRGYLAQQVAQILRVPVEELSLDEPLTYLGLDSLMALELKNRMDAGLGLSVPVTRLLEGVSVGDLHSSLMEKLAEKLAEVQAATAPVATPVPPAPAAAQSDLAAVLAQLDTMSEENIDLLLGQLLAEEGLS